MATLKPTSGDSPAAPDVRIPIGQLLDDSPRAAVALLTAAERPVWHAVHAAVRRAEEGTEFDPRCYITLEGAAVADWRARRAAWRRALLSGDPRVSEG